MEPEDADRRTRVLGEDRARDLLVEAQGHLAVVAPPTAYLPVDEVDDGDGVGDMAPPAGEHGGASGLVGGEVGEDALERLAGESAQAVTTGPLRRHLRMRR